MSKTKYFKRSTVLFKEGDLFDEELYEMLIAITPERNFPTKLKELASEHLKLTQPELYKQITSEKNKDIDSSKNENKDSQTKQQSSKVNNQLKSNLKNYLS